MIRVLEMGGFGSFLCGARIARLQPAFACCRSGMEARILEANGVSASVGPPGHVPWADFVMVSVSSPVSWEANLIQATNPRFVLAEGMAPIGPILAVGYKAASWDYSGLEFGLPQSGKKRFHVMWRKDLKTTLRDFEFPEGAMRHVPLKGFLDIDPDPSLAASAKMLAYMERRNASNAARGRGNAIRIFSPDESLMRFPRRYCREYEALVDDGHGPRKFSIQESRRIMGLPDDYLLPVPSTAAYEAIGGTTWPATVAAIVGELMTWAAF